MVGRSAGFVVTQYDCSFILEYVRTIVMIIHRYKVLAILQLGWPMFDVVVGSIHFVAFGGRHVQDCGTI